MSLEPPAGYGSASEPAQTSPEPISPPPDAVGLRDTVRPELQPDSPAQGVLHQSAESTHFTERPASSPGVPPPHRQLSRPPAGLAVVGGESVRLRKAVALDRVASGYGYLTVTWNQRSQGLDLLALQEGSSVTVRGHSLSIDLSQPLRRVLIGTGTRGRSTLPPSELVITNGATQIVVPILGGTSLGVWPRLSLTRVDEFVVVRHELDPLSGILSAVANAYGYDERSFVLAHTT